jgi:hypothetical protein
MFTQTVLAVKLGVSLTPANCLWAMEELASAALVSEYCLAYRGISNLGGKQYSSFGNDAVLSRPSHILLVHIFFKYSA